MGKGKRVIIKVVFTVVIILAIILFIFIRLKKEEPNSLTNSDFEIENYNSEIDKDSDGIDDQTDFLNSVKDYIDTNPKYKSKYYDSGFPDDEYGVCTDVVGFGLLGSGYNLMDLVNTDIIENPDDYAIETIDKNIDFRRVKNLYVYFENNAISLTTNIYDIKEWQGGDIVVFESHIGVVSDKRNEDGITYIIHHNGVLQLNYEEDILEKRDDILGHFRIS